MRWVLLLGLIGGCGTLVPPAAMPVTPEPAAGATRDEPSLPLTVHQADPDRPRSVCDGEGAPISQWPDALIRAARAVD